VAETLPVHLGGDGPGSVRVPESFETSGQFDLEIHNHGTPAHVHVHLDEALGAVAALRKTNVYVEGDATQVVSVEVAESFGTVAGTLDVVTGYGAESTPVDVTLTEPETVSVDESLAEPQSTTQTESSPSRSVPVVAVSVAVVVALVATVAFVDDALVLPLGVVAVAVGTAVAFYLLSSS
jgi:hypothetical protein